MYYILYIRPCLVLFFDKFKNSRSFGGFVFNGLPEVKSLKIREPKYKQRPHNLRLLPTTSPKQGLTTYTIIHYTYILMKYYKYLLGVIFFNESYKYNDISIGILCCIAVGNHHSQSIVVFF